MTEWNGIYFFKSRFSCTAWSIPPVDWVAEWEKIFISETKKNVKSSIACTDTRKTFISNKSKKSWEMIKSYRWLRICANVFIIFLMTLTAIKLIHFPFSTSILLLSRPITFSVHDSHKTHKQCSSRNKKKISFKIVQRCYYDAQAYISIYCRHTRALSFLYVSTENNSIDINRMGTTTVFFSFPSWIKLCLYLMKWLYVCGRSIKKMTSCLQRANAFFFIEK